MKFFQSKTVFVLALTAALAACNKDEMPSGGSSFSEASQMEDLQVPANFTFETTREVRFDFDFSEAPQAGAIYKLELYTYLPQAGGELIYSGPAQGGNRVSGEVLIPAYLTQLYAQVVYPSGSKAIYALDAQGNSTSGNLFLNKKVRKTVPVSPDCNSGCDESYTNHSGNLNINNNDPGGIYCLKGNHTGNINVNRGGVTLRICGNANVTRFNLNSGSSLEIVSGASLTIQDLNLNSSQATLVVYPNATLTCTNNFGSQAQVTNYGTIEVQNNYNINANGQLENNGYVEVGVDMNQSGSLVNNNHLYVIDDLSLNGGSVTVNNCKLIVDDDLQVNGDFTHKGYLFAGDEFQVNGGADVFFENGAMSESQRLRLNGTIQAIGSTSLIKVISTGFPSSGTSLETVINGGGGINGNAELCDANGIETNNGSLTNGAVLGCGVYIPTDACNPSGNGTPSIVDTDNDGVADDNDDYPTDPSRAFTDYAPSQNDFGTLAYEDLWPNRGDYDFNDLVVDYNYTIVKNAQNEVVDVKAKYVVRAIGASKVNGFGIQFDANATAVASVTGQQLTENIIVNNGNGTEAGLTKATVIIFDNAFEILPNLGTPFVNTEANGPYSTPDTTDITVNFGTPVALANLGAAPFNPFIFVDGDRTLEVHLAGNAPTAKANTNIFGTGNDDTNPGASKFYQDVDNLPWALNISTGFDYPLEKEDIVGVYNNFDTWAQSGGVQFPNWFLDQPGNIVTSKLFMAP